MIRLYTTFYKERDLDRLDELLIALKTNLELPEIEKVYVLNEGANLSGLLHNKLEIIPILSRPTYNQFFRIINNLTNLTDINVIANTDIYFDKNINALKKYKFDGICLALSRWDLQEDGVFKLNNRNDSQDTWIFQGSVKETVNGDFFLGVPRCDNRLLYELQKAGYTVLNPAYSIKTYHLHAGSREQYSNLNKSNYIPPPYRYMYPHNLYNLLFTIIFNLCNRYKLVMYHYDLKKNKSMATYAIIPED
ncbi:MAG: hypothetical protein HC831_15270 [Chloroflexia bacterium]|nr:hypothetical protein [Chloroflexia bacterium]